jgi:hypothetical protein
MDVCSTWLLIAAFFGFVEWRRRKRNRERGLQ